MKLFLSILFLQFSFLVLAISSDDTEPLYRNAEKLLYQNPNKSLKFTRYILENREKTSSNSYILKAYLLQSEILIFQEDYRETILSLTKSSELMRNEKNQFLKTKYYYLLSKVLLQLNMIAEFDQAIVQFKHSSQSLENVELQCSADWLSELMILKKFVLHHYSESLQIINNKKIKSNALDRGLHDRILLIYNSIILNTRKDDQIKNKFETPFYSYISTVNTMTHEIESGSRDFKKTKVLEKERLFFGVLNFVPLYYALSLSACESDFEGDCFFYKNLYIKSLKDNLANKQTARLALLNLLQQNNQMEVEKTRSNFIKIGIAISVLGILSLFVLLGYFYHLKIKLRRIVVKKESNKIYDDFKQQLSNQNKNIPIPQKTEQIILSKLVEFEHNKDFLSAELSLSYLSNRLETNSKYLSEVINKHKNKNFNTYVNELRIAYIIDKLINNPEYRQYKSSYLATETGFSSRTSFSTIFKNIAGKSLTQYIEQLENNHE